MKLSKRFIFVSIFLLVIIIASIILSILAYTFRIHFLNPSDKAYEDIPSTNYNFINNENKKYETNSQGNKWKFKNVIGWIPSFDYQNAKDDFYKNINYFTEVSPIFYSLSTDGSIITNSYAHDTNLISIAHSNHVKVTPTITSFNENELQSLINDQAKLKLYEEFIYSEIAKYNYDGIDLDYESINDLDREPYFKMLGDLASQLHNQNKILSVTVVSKDKETGYSSLIETRGVQNWQRISKYADEIRIMAYDYSDEKTPGPVAPINWVQDILSYGISTAPKEKLILAQPLYGYAYGIKRYAYTYNEISEIIKGQNLTPEFDRSINEKILSFKKGTETRVLWFQDYETMLKRFSLVDQANIGGVSYWRLGGEDSLIYSALSRQN